MNENSKDILIQKISLAFRNVEYSGDDNLVDESYDDEPGIIRNHFRGYKDWTTLTPDFLDIDGALSFLSDKAFRFFLPAFLIADINQKLDYNDPTVRLCWSLTPQSENKKIAKIFGGQTIGERARTCFDAFTKEQVSAIVSYLHWRLSKDKHNNTIEQALENYWLQREKKNKILKK
ncbi:MAG: hypothetical protein KA163_10385 [Bacteroidia bacterium]|nr:hypothetical protein [Bacteroidia bacterium]